MEKPVHHIDALPNAVTDKIPPGIPGTTKPVEDSTTALLEIFSYAQQILSALRNMHNNRDHYNAAYGLSELELLKRENKLLKNELSKLDKLIKENL